MPSLVEPVHGFDILRLRDDDPVMDYDHVRDAISARLDGEELGIKPALLERHVRSCFRCRQWEGDGRGSAER